MAYANFKRNSGKNISFVPVAQGAAGTTVLIVADPAKKHSVVSSFLVMDAAGTLKFTDGAGDLTGAMSIALSAGFVLPPGVNNYFETSGVNQALNLVTTTGKAAGVVAIISEAV